MLKTLVKPPQSDVEKWRAKIADLKAQLVQAERDGEAALKALSTAMLDGKDDGGDAVVRVEARKRGLALAITEAEARYKAAQEGVITRKLEAAKAAEPKLLAEVRAAWINYGKALAADLAAAQAIATARDAYHTNANGMDLPDRARMLGSPDGCLDHVINYARALETLLGPEDYKLMGLPPYHSITLKAKP